MKLSLRRALGVGVLVTMSLAPAHAAPARAADVSESAAVRFRGDADTRFTGLVRALGDVNGDGVEDFGLSTRDRTAGDNFEIFTARPRQRDLVVGKLGRSAVRMLDPDPATTQGMSVAGAGDVNGDGLDDVVFGIGGASPSGRPAAGAAFVVFGNRRLRPGRNGSGDFDGFAIAGPSEGMRLGSTVDSAGDINGDGLADLVVGANTSLAPEPKAAEAFVVYGKRDTGPVDVASPGPWGFTVTAGDSETAYAYGTAAGDANGDGREDVAVLFAGGTREAHVVFGGHPGEAVDLHRTPEAGIRVTDGWFSTHTAAGDFNGDGRADLALGAPRGLVHEPCPFTSGCGIGPVYEDPGSVVVVFGGDAGTVDARDLGDRGLRIDRLGAAEDWMGSALAGGVDFDRDGYDDLAIGAPGEGSVYVVRGARGGGRLWVRKGRGRVFRFDSRDEQRPAGRGVAWLARWDGDRLPDLLVATRSSVEAAPHAYLVRGFVRGRCRNRSLGARGRDYLGGTAAGDHIRGSRGPDLIVGLTGDDCLFGGHGRDRLRGGRGRDTVMDRHGRNRVRGGRGRDYIDVRNGARDRINCGPGRDTLRPDRRDRWDGCERVRMPRGEWPIGAPRPGRRPCKIACAVTVRTDPSG